MVYIFASLREFVSFFAFDQMWFDGANKLFTFRVTVSDSGVSEISCYGFRLAKNGYNCNIEVFYVLSVHVYKVGDRKYYYWSI